MQRRIGLFLASAMLATIAMFAPASPASASHTDVCAGQGNATLGAGLGYPVNTVHNLHPHSTTFSFTFGLVGACAVKVSLSATGTVTGFCGNSFGAGVTSNAHAFSFVSVGTVLVLSGQVTGVVSALPDPTHSGSCTNETAVRFLITGAVTLRPCNKVVTATVTTLAGGGNVQVCR